MKPGTLAILLLTVMGLAGCGLSGVMMAGRVVNAAAQAAVDYQDAQDRKGPGPELDYAWTKEVLEANAVQGDPEAQYRFGLFYMAHEQRDAEPWICQAANRGHPKAQVQLAHWYNERRFQEDLWPFIRISPDDRSAFVWYSLAAAKGEAVAGVFRDRIEDRLAAVQLSEAKSRLDTWSPSPCSALQAAATP